MIVNHPTVFVRRVIYDRFGLFDLDYRIIADWELIYRFYRSGVKFQCINEVLTVYQIGGISYSPSYLKIKEKYRFRKQYNTWGTATMKLVRETMGFILSKIMNSLLPEKLLNKIHYYKKGLKIKLGGSNRQNPII